MSQRISRREFVRNTGLYGAGLLIALDLPRPRAAAAAAASKARSILSEHEWRTIESACARIIPSSSGGEPGAREAGCVNFIDKALAHEDAEALPLYRAGVQCLDTVATTLRGEPFAKLEEEDQDDLLRSLELGDVPGWPVPKAPPQLLFETLRAHTIIGFLADPKYGGNRDYAGWRVAGYPGGRHKLGGYTPEQVEGKTPIVPVWKGKG